MTTVELLFALLVVYQLKHFLADYILQGRYMLGKFRPGWDFVGPLLAHVGVHATFTYVISLVTFRLVLGTPAPGSYFYWALLIAGADAFIHFFMDRIKASPRYLGRFKPVTAEQYRFCLAALSDTDIPAVLSAREQARKHLRGNTLFWWSLGFDQMVHHLTHYGCIYLILLALGLP